MQPHVVVHVKKCARDQPEIVPEEKTAQARERGDEQQHSGMPAQPERSSGVAPKGSSVRGNGTSAVPKHLQTRGLWGDRGGLCRAAPGVAAKPRAQLLRFVDLGTSKSGSVVPDITHAKSRRKNTCHAVAVWVPIRRGRWHTPPRRDGLVRDARGVWCLDDARVRDMRAVRVGGGAPACRGDHHRA